jgi:uncharacterized protein
MMRVFLDANILFTAAHNPQGKAALIIELKSEGHYLLFTSDAAIEECKRNLAVKYPDSLPRLDCFSEGIEIFTADLSAPFPKGLPAKDAVIFQAAVAGNATHLLTGDHRHFGPFMNQSDKTYSIVIQTVGEFLEAL